jgi:hypothetical protein
MPPAIRVRVNHPTYIVSDNNINLLNFTKYDHSKTFYIPYTEHFKATHMQNDSFLLIDCIFSNNIISHTETGTIICDHFINFNQIPFLLNPQGNSQLKKYKWI